MDQSIAISGAFERLWSGISIIAVRAGCFACLPDWGFTDRVRPHHQLWLTLSGTATIVAAAHSFALTPGTVFLVSPNVPHHGSHDPKDPLRCYVLHFALRLASAVAPLWLDVLPRILRPSPTVWSGLLEGASQVCAELTGSSPGYALLANGAMAQILGQVWREAVAQGTLHTPVTTPNDSTTGLAAVLTYMTAHFAEPQSLTDLAEVAGFSRTHFSTVFRRATGLSPIQYLQHYRLERAKELLVTTDASMASIAASVGMGDPFYLSRVFKRAEGLSPTAYRLTKRTSSSP